MERENLSSKVNLLPSRREEVALLAERYPEARELIVSNPALSLCVACSPSWDTLRDQDPADRTRLLLRVRRREACALLGFPGTERVVRLLSKVSPGACSLPLLMRLRRTIAEPRLAQVLQHMPVVDGSSLFLAAHWRWAGAVSPPLFAEMAQQCGNGNLPRFGDILDDTLRMLTRLGEPVRPFRSLAEAQRCHDRLAERINDEPDEEISLMSDLTFPPPPVAGTENIVPLDTPALLLAEGRDQHHCVAVLDSAVADGDVYVYRVMAPERATLSIIRSGDSWSVDQLKGVCNREVRTETRWMVDEWLSRNGYGSSQAQQKPL